MFSQLVSYSTTTSKAVMGQVSKERLLALQVECWDVNQMTIKGGRTYPPPPQWRGIRKRRENKYGLEVVTLVWNHSSVSPRRHKQESLSYLTLLFLGRIKAICPFFVLDPNCIFLKPKVLARTFISTNKLQWAQELVIEAIFKPLQLVFFFLPQRNI